MSVYTIKVDESRPATGETPSAGPAYRCIYAKDALMELPPGYESPWDFFRLVDELYMIRILLTFKVKSK
ncbi:hypothetical protein L2E82_02168 [Cichorium intybus]|uniref:Uncharacterized protein n=1 Tax=Cichorium intybus TaxID=13427 RepID=A0ACB9H0W6_CICIN|nr:hypothetical protein L2E82_02168 [Cichorium intybus]